MDFYGMKRKRLQSLCKKYGIPANLKNTEMADRLTLIFKEKENSVSFQLGSDNVGTEKGTFDCVSSKEMLNVETLELDSNNVHLSGLKSLDGTSDQVLPTDPPSEMKSSDLNIHQMGASGTAAGNADDCEVKSVSPQMISLSPEERIDLPPKHLENSQIKPKTSFSPERDDTGCFSVEENLQMSVNEEQVDDNQELHAAAPTGTVVMKDVASDEFGNYLVEGEVEKLGDKIDVHGDVCRTRKVGAECERQAQTNSPQGSIINCETPSHVSPKEFSGHLVEGEVHKLDDSIYVHGAVNDDINGTCEAAPMCLHASIGAKDTDGKTNVTVELLPDEVHSSNSEDSDRSGTKSMFMEKIDVHGDVCGARKAAAECEKQNQTNSPQVSNINCETPSHVSPKELSGNLVEGEVNKLDDSIFVHGVVNDDRNDTCEATPMCLDASIGAKDTDGKTNVTVQHLLDEVHSSSSEDSDRSGTKLTFMDKIDVHGDVCGTRNVGAGCEKQDQTNSPQGSIINCETPSHVSPKEFSSNLVEEEVHKLDESIFVHGAVNDDRNDTCDATQMCLDASIGAKDIGGKTNVTVQHLLDEVHSSISEDSDRSGTKLMFMEKIDVHGDVAGTRNVGVECEKQDQTNSPQGSIINCENPSHVSPMEFSGNLVEGEVHKLDDSIFVHGVVNENRNDTCEAAPMCLDASIGAKDTDGKTNVTVEHLLDVVHSSSFEDSDRSGTKLMFMEKIDVHGDVCGTRNVGAECEKQDQMNSPQGSIINCETPSHVRPKEFSGNLVEGEVHKLDGSIFVHGAVNDDKNDTCEAAPMSLDASIGANDTDGKTNVTVDLLLDEVHSSSSEDSDRSGTPVQFLPTYPLSEMKTCDLDIHKMVVPGTAIKNTDACEGKFVSSQKISRASEKMIDFSPKLLNNSDTPRDDIGIFVVEENVQSGVSKDQIDHSQEVLHAAPSVVVMNNEDLDLVQVALEESVNHLEGEVEKLGDKFNPLEDVCETEKGRDEAVKQGGMSSPQGSNINDVHLLHVTSEKSIYPLVEGEVHKSEADTMCLNKDTDENTKVTAEHFQEEVYSSSLKSSDGTPDQFLPTYPLSEVKSSDLSIHQIVASDAGYLTAEHILREVHLSTFAGYKDHVDHSQVLHPVPNVVPVNTEDYGFFEEGEFEDVGDKIDLLEDVSGTGKGREEAVNQGGIYSHQGSNINDVNLLHGSPEESSYPLVEEVQKSYNNDFHDGFCNLRNSGSDVDAMCLLDSSIAAKDIDRKINVTMEHIPDDVHSLTPDQFLENHPPSEVVSSDLNINQMVAAETCEELLKSSQKTGLIADPEECTGFSPNKLEASVTKGFEAEPYFDPSTLGDVVGTCNMKESMQSDKMEKENCQEECSLVQGEDIHDDTRAVPTGAEDENQPYMVSHKRKKRDMDSLESSMMKKKLEIETNFPMKPGRDGIGICDMKENIKHDKKEQVGMTISKNTFPKRQPLQDLRQN